MKKILYIVVFITTFAALYSCDDSDSRNTPLRLPETTEVTGELTMKSEFSAPGYKAGFSFTIPQSYTNKAEVTVTATTSDFAQSTAVITLEAGETSASGTITMPEVSGGLLSNLLSGYADIVKVKLTGLKLVTDDGAGNTIPVSDDTVTLTSNEVTMDYYDWVQAPYRAGVVAGRATILFDWENPSSARDLDMRVFTSTFDLVESAGSGSRWETDILDTDHPDGDYFVVIDVWRGSGDIPWKFFFVHPDQVTMEVFEGTFTAAEIASGIIFPVIEWTKTTTNGVVSYSVRKP